MTVRNVGSGHGCPNNRISEIGFVNDCRFIVEAGGGWFQDGCVWEIVWLRVPVYMFISNL